MVTLATAPMVMRSTVAVSKANRVTTAATTSQNVKPTTQVKISMEGTKDKSNYNNKCLEMLIH